MTNLPPLIEDLGLILMAAAVVTLMFKKLKQPVVLGYLQKLGRVLRSPQPSKSYSCLGLAILRGGC